MEDSDDIIVDGKYPNRADLEVDGEKGKFLLLKLIYVDQSI